MEDYDREKVESHLSNNRLKEKNFDHSSPADYTVKYHEYGDSWHPCLVPHC